MSVILPPTLKHEQDLFGGGARIVAGMDEVGRGAIAGPVSVGVVAIASNISAAPKGVKDSKLLTPKAREDLAPKLALWAPWHAVGHASSAEIDDLGLIAALRLAGQRALAALPVAPDVLLLDCSHDWLTEPEPDLFSTATMTNAPRVVTIVKGDQKCVSIAAASVLAKVERDDLLRLFHEDYPAYDWVHNKGYASPEHIAALRAIGACILHRRSWDLPGLAN